MQQLMAKINGMFKIDLSTRFLLARREKCGILYGKDAGKEAGHGNR